MTTEADSLFDLEPAPRSRLGAYGLVRNDHPTTSVQAAEQIGGKAATLRERVYRAIRDSRTTGLTDEEGITATGLPPSTYRPRRVELVRDGHVLDSGRRRTTASRRAAIVWVIGGAL